MGFLHLRDSEPEVIVAATLDLNDLEKEIYTTLQDRELTVKDLVEATGRTRSVVQRALQRMLDLGILAREGRTDKTVYYVYTAVPLDRVKDMVAGILDDWYEDVRQQLE